MAHSRIFDETYESYLSRIAKLDMTRCQDILGIDVLDDQALIPFFDKTYRIGGGGIVDINGQSPKLSVCVILSNYLIMCPDRIPANDDLAAFKDFRDAAPLVHYFTQTVEGEVVRQYGGRVSELERACLALGGKPYDRDLAYQIKYRFRGLPKVPVYLLYNDAVEGFAAQCNILFDRRAEVYLDMESLAMLGASLSQRLSPLSKFL